MYMILPFNHKHSLHTWKKYIALWTNFLWAKGLYCECYLVSLDTGSGCLCRSQSWWISRVLCIPVRTVLGPCCGQSDHHHSFWWPAVWAACGRVPITLPQHLRNNETKGSISDTGNNLQFTGTIWRQKPYTTARIAILYPQHYLYHNIPSTCKILLKCCIQVSG